MIHGLVCSAGSHSSLQLARQETGAVVLEGEVWALGGLVESNGGFAATSTVERYAPATGWTFGPPLRLATMSPPQLSTAASGLPVDSVERLSRPRIPSSRSTRRAATQEGFLPTATVDRYVSEIVFLDDFELADVQLWAAARGVARSVLAPEPERAHRWPGYAGQTVPVR